MNPIQKGWLRLGGPFMQFFNDKVATRGGELNRRGGKVRQVLPFRRARKRRAHFHEGAAAGEQPAAGGDGAPAEHAVGAPLAHAEQQLRDALPRQHQLVPVAAGVQPADGYLRNEPLREDGVG